MTEEMITEDRYPDNESLVGHVISEFQRFLESSGTFGTPQGARMVFNLERWYGLETFSDKLNFHLASRKNSGFDFQFSCQTLIKDKINV